VTGAAGFIGSTLTDRLVAGGHRVVAVDALTDYYDPEVKRSNLQRALDSGSVEFVPADLTQAPLAPLLDEIDVVYHLAGQPGVRASWGEGFGPYVARNVVATQRLLEACRTAHIARFVNSSSSSVYGRAERLPTAETDLPAPVSPYGVTKLAAEHLCTLYATEFAMPTVSLRYFTVYGPRQRPDMATHRAVEAAFGGPAFPMNGDGSQIRDFTYVDDVVNANLLATGAEVPNGSVFNIGGGARTTLAEVVAIVKECVGKPVPIEYKPPSVGDPQATGADIRRASALLGWHPEVCVEDGVRRQVEWHRSRSRP
jgi:nucleoside-diphosphate-sugar epimerase